MTKNEVTSNEIASIAAKGLAHPEKLTLNEISAVCGSALTQALASGELQVNDFIAVQVALAGAAAPVAAVEAIADAPKKRRRKRKNAGGRPKGSKNKVKK